MSDNCILFLPRNRLHIWQKIKYSKPLVIASPTHTIYSMSLAGFQYAGLQFSTHCFCGNSYTRYGRAPESECNRDCPADGSLVSIVEGHGETLSTVQGILVGMVNQRQNILLFLSSVKILDHCLRFSILWMYHKLVWIKDSNYYSGLKLIQKPKKRSKSILY